VQLAAAVFIATVGVVLAWGASRFPIDKGYSILGPQVFPYAVAVFLLLVAAGLGYQAVTGGFRNVAARESPSSSARAGAAWVTGGLLAIAALITHLGFVLSAALLFALAARGFGSRRPRRDLAIGAALTLPVFWIFTLGLGVSLPSLANAWI
jgi:putative tricarboxylic transport membrane protein